MPHKHQLVNIYISFSFMKYITALKMQSTGVNMGVVDVRKTLSSPLFFKHEWKLSASVISLVDSFFLFITLVHRC